MTDPPRLVEPIEIIPIDTSSTMQKYLMKTAANRRFEVSETIFNIVALIDGTRSLDCIASELSKIAGRNFSPEEIEKVIAESLIPSGIVAAGDRVRPGKRVPSYLQLRVPLFSQRFIRPITSRLHPMFRPGFLLSGLAISVLFVLYFYLFASRPSLDLATMDIVHLAEIYGIFLVATLVHELGHSAACYHFGARPGDIGIGLYLYFPVFYTDVSDVWKLKRVERAAVDIGGIYFQTLLLPLLYFIYLFSGNAVYAYAIYLLTFSSLTSLNPLFRFDGYWLASDLAGLPNLRKRSGVVVRDLIMKIRGRVGNNRSPVSRIPTGVRNFLYVYTVASNIFFLFFFYEILSNLPFIFRDYPGALSAFVSGVLNVARDFDYRDMLRRLSEVFFPTTILVMFLMMAYRGVRNVLKRLLDRRTHKLSTSAQ